MTQSGGRNAYYPGTKRVRQASDFFLQTEVRTHGQHNPQPLSGPYTPSGTKKLGLCVEQNKDVRGKSLLWGPAVRTCTAGKHLLPADQALGPLPSLLGSTSMGSVCLLPSSNFYFWTSPSERHILSSDVVIPSIRLLWPERGPFI